MISQQTMPLKQGTPSKNLIEMCPVDYSRWPSKFVLTKIIFEINKFDFLL